MVVSIQNAAGDAGGARVGCRQALWDLETTITTFNNNFILRAHLEQADGKTSGSWRVVRDFSRKERKGRKERGMGNGEWGSGWILILTQRHRDTESQRCGNFSVPLCLISASRPWVPLERMTLQ